MKKTHLMKTLLAMNWSMIAMTAKVDTKGNGDLQRLAVFCKANGGRWHVDCRAFEGRICTGPPDFETSSAWSRHVGGMIFGHCCEALLIWCVYTFALFTKSVFVCTVATCVHGGSCVCSQ